MYSLKTGDIVFIRDAGRGLVAYDSFGKVILPTNKNIREGYAEIVKIVKDAEKYYKAELKNVAHDLHHEISKEELMEVVKLHGYKLGFIEPFISPYDGIEEFQYFFYNLENGNLLTGETYNGCWNSFNVHIHCDGFFIGRTRYIHTYGMDKTVLRLTDNCQLFYEYGILTLANMYAQRGHGRKWMNNSYFSLWHYGESHRYDDIREVAKTANNRIAKCPADIWEILGDVNGLKHLH